MNGTALRIASGYGSGPSTDVAVSHTMCLRLRLTTGQRALARVATLVTGSGHRIVAAHFVADGDGADLVISLGCGPSGLRNNLAGKLGQLVDVEHIECVPPETRDRLPAGPGPAAASHR